MRRFAFLLFALIGPAACASRADGEQLFRWKLEQGQSFRVRFDQTSNTVTTVLNKPVKMSVKMTMEMLWQVDGVDQDGTADMTQSFTRMTIKMDAPSVGSIEYDSAAGYPTDEAAEPIADALEPLISAGFKVKMNSRGGIVDVRLSQEVLDAFEFAPTTSKLRELFTKEGLTETLRQSAALLPQSAVNVGDSWNTENEAKTPLGAVKQLHKYTYAGSERRGETTLERVTVTTKIDLTNTTDGPGSRLKLKAHEQTGTLYFDVTAGRFAETVIRQKLTSETPYRDMIIKVEVDSSTTMSIASAPWWYGFFVSGTVAFTEPDADQDDTKGQR